MAGLGCACPEACKGLLQEPGSAHAIARVFSAAEDAKAIEKLGGARERGLSQRHTCRRDVQQSLANHRAHWEQDVGPGLLCSRSRWFAPCLEARIPAWNSILACMVSPWP